MEIILATFFIFFLAYAILSGIARFFGINSIARPMLKYFSPLALFLPFKKGAKFLNTVDSRAILNPRNTGLVLDGERRRLNPEDSFKHLCLVGKSGGGKTSSFVIPNVLTLDNCSMVVTDPSGEIFEKTSGALERKGFKVLTLNPTDIERSNRYNPLEKVKEFNDIGEIAKILVDSGNPGDKEPIWNNGASLIIETILRVLIGMGKPEFQNLHNLLFLLNNFGERGENLDRFMARYADRETYNQYKGFISGNEKTLQSYLIVAVTALRALSNPDIAKLLSRSDFEFEDLRKQKTILYIIIPSDKIEYYSFFLNLFYTQFFNFCVSKLPDKKDLPIYVIYDEFGHSSIPRFDAIINTIRKYKVSLSIILQSVSQLEKNYGRIGAKAILEGGVSSKLFLAGADLDTARMVEQLLGKEELVYPGQDGIPSYKERNLMNADRIRTLKEDEALFIFYNKEPIRLNLNFYYKQGRFKRMTKLAPVELRRRPPQELEYFDLKRLNESRHS